MAGFVEFFYNIIPGGLFLIALAITFDWTNPLAIIFERSPNKGEVLLLSIFIILSLFLGFTFQMINSWLTKLNINKPENLLKEKYLDGKKVDNIQNYDSAHEIVSKLGVQITKDEKFIWLLQLNHYMDDFLRFKGASSLHKFFHFRISLWANIFLASLIYLLIFLIALPTKYTSFEKHIYFYTAVSAVAIFSLIAAKKSQEIFYDFALKTFLIATGDKNISSRNRSRKKPTKKRKGKSLSKGTKISTTVSKRF